MHSNHHFRTFSCICLLTKPSSSTRTQALREQQLCLSFHDCVPSAVLKSSSLNVCWKDRPLMWLRGTWMLTNPENTSTPICTHHNQISQCIWVPLARHFQNQHETKGRNKRQNEVSWTPTGEQLSLVFADCNNNNNEYNSVTKLHGSPMCQLRHRFLWPYKSTIKHTRLPLFYRRGNYYLEKSRILSHVT